MINAGGKNWFPILLPVEGDQHNLSGYSRTSGYEPQSYELVSYPNISDWTTPFPKGV